MKFTVEKRSTKYQMHRHYVTLLRGTFLFRGLKIHGYNIVQAYGFFRFALNFFLFPNQTFDAIQIIFTLHRI